MAKKKHHHTGKIRHHDMGSLLDGHGSADPHADPAYKKANAAHGMGHGMSPQGEYDGGGEESEQGGEGMSENCEYHD